MVQVVLHVLYGHVLEQSTICSKNVVCPGPDLSSVPLYSPRVPVLQPQLATWEEVHTHIHQTNRREFVRNGLHPRCSFRLCQIGIEITGHQKLGTVRLIPDCRYNVLYGRGVAGENIAPRGMPPPPPNH